MKANTRYPRVMSRNRKQGSILITALIVTFILTLIVGSYLRVSAGEHSMAKRSFYMGAAFSLAEGGADYAIKALNEGSAIGWSVSGDTWTRALSNFTVSSGATGSLKIRIDDATSDAPEIFSQATISNPGSRKGDVVRQIKVVLEEQPGGGTLGDALLYARTLDASGNNTLAAMFDSRLGDIGDWYADDEGKWQFNLDDDLRVVIDSITSTDGNFGNMDVFGWVVTGEGGSVNFNAQGGTFQYGGSDTDPTDGIWDGKVASDRVTDDFYGSFDSVEAPSVSITQNSASLSFVSTGSGKSKANVATWGDQEVKYTGTGTVLSLGNNERLDITGDVVIVVEGGGAIDIKGELKIVSGGSLQIYTDGNIDVGGSGIVNQTNLAENLQVYGTNSTVNAQTFKFHGNTAMTGFVYAPDAAADLKGGGGAGMFQGALVMNRIKITGNYYFIGDAALGDMFNVPTGTGGYDVTDWIELTNTTTETARVVM